MSKKQIEHSKNYMNTIEDVAFNLVVVSDGDDDELELIYDRYLHKTRCICGSIILDKNIAKHDKSKKHIKYLDKLISNQRENNIII